MPQSWMPQFWMPGRYAILLAAGLAAAPGVALGQSQPSEPAPSFAPAAPYEPSYTPAPASEPEQSVLPSDDDPLFGQSLDLSSIETGTSHVKIDPSKFTSVKTPSTGWSAKAGVDYAPAAPATALPSDLLLPNAPPMGQTGPAWANVTAPALDSPLSWDKASIETRVDPSQDQSKLGMSFSRSVPVGSSLSVTLQNGYSMTQTLPGAVGALPPVPATTAGALASATPGRVLDTNQALKFNILPSDTTFSVGAAISNADPKWLRSFSAEQKLFGGPLNITGSVSQTTTGELNKTLMGGFKQAW